MGLKESKAVIDRVVEELKAECYMDNHAALDIEHGHGDGNNSFR